MIVGLGQGPEEKPGWPAYEKVVQGKKILVLLPDFEVEAWDKLASMVLDEAQPVTVSAGGAVYSFRAPKKIEGAAGTSALSWVKSVLASGKGVMRLASDADCGGASDCHDRVLAVTLDEASAISSAEAGLVIFEPREWVSGSSTGWMWALGLGLAGAVVLGVVLGRAKA